MRRKWFEKARASGAEIAVDGYEFALKRGTRPSRDLVVAFSSGRRFALYRHDFGRDALYVADPELRYFLKDADGLAREILRFVEREGYERVLFAGSSKGGFGALSVARLCARRRPSRTFHALAFSPQVRLFPHNPSLYFSSYRRLERRGSAKPRLMRDLRRHGDVSSAGSHPNLVVEIVFARDAEVDRAEAARLRGSNVVHRVVAGATHGTAFHFMCHGMDRTEIRERIRRAYRRSGDADVRQTRPSDMRAMVEEVARSAVKEPPLNLLIDHLLGRRPAPMTRGERVAASARRWFDALAVSAEKTRSFALGQS